MLILCCFGDKLINKFGASEEKRRQRGTEVFGETPDMSQGHFVKHNSRVWSNVGLRGEGLPDLTG